MPIHNTPYYESSGKAPLGGAALMLIGGLFAGFILSFPYVYATLNIPSMFVRIFVTIAYALAMGWVLGRLLRLGKIRSTKKACIIALIVGIGTLWFSWTFFLAHISADSEYPLVTAYIAQLNPQILFNNMAEVYGHGTWTIGNGNNQPIHGILLGCVWFIEALMIVGIPLLWTLASDATRFPFSETLNRLATREKLSGNPPLFPDITSAKNVFENGDFSALLNAAKCPDSPFSYIELYAVEGDPDCHFLSLTNVTVRPDKNGKPLHKEVPIIEHLRITPELHQKLRAQFGPTI